MRKLFLIFMILFAGISVINAQKFKYGYLNAEKLLNNMPEIQNGNKELEAYIKPINEYIQTKNKEYQDKLAKLKSQQKNLSDFLKAEKEKELQKIQTDIQEFKLKAQKEIDKKKKSYYDTAILRLKETIKKFAKEKGYRFILDNSKGQLLYAEDEDNIETLIEKRLKRSHKQ